MRKGEALTGGGVLASGIHSDSVWLKLFGWLLWFDRSCGEVDVLMKVERFKLKGRGGFVDTQA